jgi:hypothetical protein
MRICVLIHIGNRKLPVDETSRQFFCKFLISKGELVEQVLPLEMVWARVGRYDM